jgi:hypothetical protein
MMQPEADGRTLACAYCHTRVQVAIDGAQIAAGMGLDLANMDAFLGKLAGALSQGFAEHTKIDARGGWVMSIDVMLEPDRFWVQRSGQQLVAQHQRVVRGIALRTQTIALDRWVELLTDALARHANTNARAAWVLGQIKGC